MRRAVAIGVALALAVLLLAARETSADKYSVAQCGWHIGADADWADTTGGAKFRPDSWCATPAGSDPFDGVHLKSFTKGGPTVSGTRFARWRWTAPPTTGITRVAGSWWHALHDGIEQRIGAAGGGFVPFATATVTDTTPRGFAAGFASPQGAIEDRLLCARDGSKWCSIEDPSWSAVRGLTLTIQDEVNPAAGIDGQLVSGGWQIGGRDFGFWANDAGAGVRFGETFLDGSRVYLFEHPCAKALIGGEWQATRMQPCGTNVSGGGSIDTARFSDGPHSLGHCAVDFAGNSACIAPRTVLIDNSPPAHPRNLSLAGGSGWRRVDDFDFSWSNPDQGPASPIGGAYWRITGPDGYDTGVHLAVGRDLSSLVDRKLPRSGVYSLRLWLRDEAGNSNPAAAVEMPMRLDDVAPTVAFEPAAQTVTTDLPELVSAGVADKHSGPVDGAIEYRRLGTERWSELPTKLERQGAGAARLFAGVPGGLAAGTYVFRATVADAAGNGAATTRRADGDEMVLRKVPSAATSRPAARAAGARVATGSKTRLFAALRWRRRRGRRVTVPFGAGARIAGRLTTAAGAGLARRRLRVVSRPSRGALARRQVRIVRTGTHGGFSLALPSGPSRRLSVTFAGRRGLAGARRSALALRVRAAATLAAAPRELRTEESLRLWGRVRARGAPIPRRGKLVAIQYYERDSRTWRPVLVTHSDHSGRFRARYRFRYVSGAARIRLRAVALAEERWPYAPGTSRPVLVRVSG